MRRDGQDERSFADARRRWGNGDGKSPGSRSKKLTIVQTALWIMPKANVAAVVSRHSYERGALYPKESPGEHFSERNLGYDRSLSARDLDAINQLPVPSRIIFVVSQDSDVFSIPLHTASPVGWFI